MTFLWLMWVHFLLIHKFCLSSRLVLKMKKIWLIPYVLRMMQKLASTRFQYCRHSSLTSPRTCTSRRATNHSPFTTTVEATRKSCSCKSDAIPSSSTPHRTPLRSSPQQTPHHHPHLILPHSHLDVLPPPPRPCHARHRVWSSFAQSHWNVHRPSTSHHTHLRHHLPLHSQQAQIHLASIHTLKSSGLRDAAASNARGGELGTQMNPFPWKHPRLHPTDPPPPPKKTIYHQPTFFTTITPSGERRDSRTKAITLGWTSLRRHQFRRASATIPEQIHTAEGQPDSIYHTKRAPDNFVYPIPNGTIVIQF